MPDRKLFEWGFFFMQIVQLEYMHSIVAVFTFSSVSNIVEMVTTSFI